MRSLSLLAVLISLLAATAAEARLFRQTYGATVPGPDGAGCVWNLNQDYFVPRHCDSGRYDLFSACKTGHTRSPACHHLHPVYNGYCTPYGACRYRWRDHVYKAYCGCTPHRCFRGPWRLEECVGGCRAKGRECGVAGCGCGGDVGYESSIAMTGPAFIGGLESPYYGELPNVEPFGGERLGAVPAILGGTASGGAAASPAGISIPVGGAAASTVPGLGIPMAPSSGGLPLPAGY